MTQSSGSLSPGSLSPGSLGAGSLPRPPRVPGRREWWRHAVVSGALAVVSVTLAGLVVQARGGNQAVHKMTEVGVGQSVEVVDGQTVEVMGVRGGQVVTELSSSATTDGWFVAVRFKVTTPGRRSIMALKCETVTDAGRHPMALSSFLRYPEPGASNTVELIAEVPDDQLESAKVECGESPVITFRTHRVVFDLGLRDATKAAFVTASTGAVVKVGDEVIESLR